MTTASRQGPTVACIGESQCPLQLGAAGVTRKRSKPWPLQAACPAFARKANASGAGSDDSVASMAHKLGHQGTARERIPDGEKEEEEAKKGDDTNTFDSEWETFWASPYNLSPTVFSMLRGPCLRRLPVRHHCNTRELPMTATL